MLVFDRVTLIRAMERKGMSQVDLAKAIGVKRQRIWQLVHERTNNVRFATVAKIARALGIEEDVLIKQTWKKGGKAKGGCK